MNKLKKYDVVTLDASAKQALVSDTKLSGKYVEGSATYSHPSEIKMLDQKFSIPESAAGTFKDIKLKDQITLLFDVDNNIVAAYPKKEVSADMQGIVTKIDGAKGTVALMNGLVLRDITLEKDTKTDLVGRLVTVSQSGDAAVLIRRTLSGKAGGSWFIADGKLGNNAVSSKVRVYEEVLSGAPLNPISTTDIALTSIPAAQIRYTVQDNAGTITNIVLGDVTGDSWIYGIGSGKRVKGDFNAPESVNGVKWDELDADAQKKYMSDHPDRYSYTYSVIMKYWENGKQADSAEYNVFSLPGGLSGIPIGIPKGYSTDKSVINTSLDTLKLELIDTVKASAFDGSSGVRTKDGYYTLADDIGVYVSEQSGFISLQSAKSNYTSFRVYANKSAADGGKIRVIVAS